jgi:2-C-methyl-D-erythritol 4-phosphate cytidylyltransferase
VTGSLGPSVGFVLVAAGRGERLGLDRPKALVEVAGRSLVGWAVEGLRAAGAETVVVVHPPGSEDAFGAAIGDGGVVLVPGGDDRSASVRAGLDALPASVRVVAVHDAARAFTPPEVIRAAVAAVTGDVLAAAPALPVADTLKRADGNEVIATVDRRDLVAVQTPQVFPATVIRSVTTDATSATDDLALVEQGRADGRLTGRIVWVPGSTRGAKITYADDLRDAARFVEGRRES